MKNQYHGNGLLALCLTPPRNRTIAPRPLSGGKWEKSAMNKRIFILAALLVAASNVFCATLVGTPQETAPTATPSLLPPTFTPATQVEPEPIICADLPYTVTYPEAWDYYRENKADPAIKKTIESASFTDKTVEEIHEALETKKIVVVSGKCASGACPTESFRGVISSLNWVPTPADKKNNLCLVNTETGNEIAGGIYYSTTDGLIISAGRNRSESKAAVPQSYHSTALIRDVEPSFFLQTLSGSWDTSISLIEV